MRICITCAAGGHLNQIMNIMDAFKDHEIIFVTINSETTENLGKVANTYYIKDIPKPIRIGKVELSNLSFLFYLVSILPYCIKILYKEKPSIVFGNGGPATICLCGLGKLIGCKIVYLESLARVNDLSVTGKFVYNIADLFLVQWDSLTIKYNKAKYWGKVL